MRFHLFFVMALFMSTNVFAQDCPDSCEYFIKNTLTPDSEEINGGILEIPSSCPFKTFEFTLFNKWGEVIYHSTDPKMKFDSTGHKDGVYIWKLKGEFCNGYVFDNQGYINIIR